MTPNKKNTPDADQATGTNEQVPSQSSTRKSTRRATGRKPMRGKLKAHMIVPENIDYRTALCGKRIRQETAVTYVGKRHPKYDFNFCEDCEFLSQLDNQLAEHEVFALTDHLRERLVDR